MTTDNDREEGGLQSFILNRIAFLLPQKGFVWGFIIILGSKGLGPGVTYCLGAIVERVNMEILLFAAWQGIFEERKKKSACFEGNVVLMKEASSVNGDKQV